jgi:hypothetical protein
LLPRKSAVYIGHSPLLVLGCPVAADWPACPETRGAATHASPLTSNASAGTVRNTVRDIYFAPAEEKDPVRRPTLATVSASPSISIGHCTRITIN